MIPIWALVLIFLYLVFSLFLFFVFIPWYHKKNKKMMKDYYSRRWNNQLVGCMIIIGTLIIMLLGNLPFNDFPIVIGILLGLTIIADIRKQFIFRAPLRYRLEEKFGKKGVDMIFEILAIILIVWGIIELIF